MFQPRLLILLLILVVFTSASSLIAGTLNSVRDQTRSTAKPKSSDQRKQGDDEEDDDDDDDDDDSIASGVLSGIVKQVVKRRQPKPARQPRKDLARGHLAHHQPGRSPVSLGLHMSSRPSLPPPVIVEEHHHFYGQPMEVISSPSDVPPPLPSAPIMETQLATPQIAPPPMEFCQPWHVRFGMEYGSDTDDLSQFGFDFLGNRTAGLGIDTSVRMHREQGYDFRDHLWIGDCNIVYELFPTEHIRPRAGIGVNWLADNYGGEAGLNLTLGLDARLWERLILTGEIDYGALGDADFLHGRATLGYGLTEHVEWFAGYDHVDIGGVEIQGVVTGIRFRF